LVNLFELFEDARTCQRQRYTLLLCSVEFKNGWSCVCTLDVLN